MSFDALRTTVNEALDKIQDAIDQASMSIHIAIDKVELFENYESEDDDLEDEEDEQSDILAGDCSFPIVWSVGDAPCDGEGNDPITDPLVLRVHSEDELTDPNTKYDISLQDAVSGLIDMLNGDDDMTLVAMQVRDALAELSDQITIALDAQ
jgi:sugar-specific transcriptional regulator TrmB